MATLGSAAMVSAAVLAGASAASADAADLEACQAQKAVCFFANGVEGTPAVYPGAPTTCTVLPFTVHTEFNFSTSAIQVYKTTDCTGHALTFPANDFHTFNGFDGRSFKAAS
ncbi:hypothetical protein ACTMTF_19960 [Nonomuraea sp. ZG12]|jgi:uncharacterized membrane protein|uniref:hypothetical protein n=1 Tax=Nonomuraea sp. ZG12 TaxID=3452207 RepID=UPI003F8BBFBD